MATLELEHVYPHSFIKVVAAYLRKYPHKRLQHVHAIDTLERYVEDGKLHSHRILFSKFLAFQNVGFESSVIDRETQTIMLKTQNLKNRSVLTMLEDCKYQGDGQRTKYFAKTRALLPTGFGFLSGQLASKYKENFKKGIKVIEELIHKRKSKS